MKMRDGKCKQRQRVQQVGTTTPYTNDLPQQATRPIEHSQAHKACPL